MPLTPEPLRAFVVVVIVMMALATACTPVDEQADAGSGLREGFGVVEHQASFPIDAQAIHALGKATPDDGAVRCSACHADDADDFLEFTCISCHAHREAALAPTHQDLREYRYGSTVCIGCHETGLSPRRSNEIDPEVHATFFPIGQASPHRDVACGSCHAQMPAAWTDNSCAECHLREMPDLSQRHRAMRGFVADSTACKTCHAEGRAERVADHGPFRIGPGSDHDREPCLDCHLENRTDKPWARDFTKHSCVECHSVNEMNNEHRDEGDYVSYDVPRCISCHPTGRK